MEYKIHDYKFEWKGNFARARELVKLCMDDLGFVEGDNGFHIYNHTHYFKVPHKNSLFVKPTAPTSNHFAIDNRGYANTSLMAFHEPVEYEYAYSFLNPTANMKWNNITNLIERKSNKWDDSILLKWREPKGDIPEDHILVIGQMPDDETVNGFGFAGHMERIDHIVETLHNYNLGWRGSSVMVGPIVVKLHPRLKSKKYKKVIAKWKDAGVHVVQGYESIHDYLPHTRVAIIDNSTAGIECLMHEVPVISYGWPEYHWVTKKLQVLPQLVSLIEGLDIWYTPHFKENARKFIYWYIHDYLCYDELSTWNRLNDLTKWLQKES